MLDWRNLTRWATHTARLLIGIPDYESYVARHKLTHPDEPVMTYEALSEMERADEKLKSLAFRTDTMVRFFLHGEINHCEGVLDELGQFAGQETLVRTYREECKLARIKLEAQAFDGVIELSEK